MEKQVLLLGLLRQGETHGYKLNEFIDSHLKSAIRIKKPTAYHLLNKMADEGWVRYREEKEGNRPPRRVYTITEAGEREFDRLLRETLKSYQSSDLVNDIPIMFLDAIPRDEAITLLLKRRDLIRSDIEQTRHHKDHHERIFELVIDHNIRHLKTDLEWLDEVIDFLKTGL